MISSTLAANITTPGVPEKNAICNLLHFDAFWQQMWLSSLHFLVSTEGHKCTTVKKREKLGLF